MTAHSHAVLGALETALGGHRREQGLVLARGGATHLYAGVRREPVRTLFEAVLGFLKPAEFDTVIVATAAGRHLPHLPLGPNLVLGEQNLLWLLRGDAARPRPPAQPDDEDDFVQNVARVVSAPANRVQENLDGRPWPERMSSMFGFCEAAAGKGRTLILLDDAILLPKRPLNDADVPAGASHERIAKRFAELPRLAAAKGGLAVILAQSPERAAAVVAEEGFVSAALAAEGGQAQRWQQPDPGRFSQLRWTHATQLIWPGVDEGEPFGPLFPVSRARPNEPLPRLYNVLRSVPAAVLQQAVDPVHLRTELDKRVIGQEIVTRSIAKKIHERMGQEGRPGPVFTVLLAGATGSGKTEMAKALATTLFGSDKALFRVDCGGVLGEAGLQTLIGSPKGYSGSDSPGALTGHLRTTPRSVLLFDEIEKAYDPQLGPQSPLFKMLLSLLDEGRVTEQSTGETMDAKETVIFLTSNAAQRELVTVLKEHGNDEGALIDETKKALGGYFSPEFLARIDLVTTMSPLNEEARRQIVALLAGKVARLYGIDIASVSPAFADAAIAHWARVENFGIREIRRWIEDKVGAAALEAKDEGYERVDLGWRDRRVTMTDAG